MCDRSRGLARTFSAYSSDPGGSAHPAPWPSLDCCSAVPGPILSSIPEIALGPFCSVSGVLTPPGLLLPWPRLLPAAPRLSLHLLSIIIRPKSAEPCTATDRAVPFHRGASCSGEGSVLCPDSTRRPGGTHPSASRRLMPHSPVVHFTAVVSLLCPQTPRLLLPTAHPPRLCRPLTDVWVPWVHINQAQRATQPHL